MRRTLFLLFAALALAACADATSPAPDAVQARGARPAEPLQIQSLTVGINGPGTVGNYTTCTFTSSVSGGTAPYTYSWSIQGASGGYLSLSGTTGASVTATGYYYGSYGGTGSVWLILNVTAANGLTGSTAKRVYIPYSATSC